MKDLRDALIFISLSLRSYFTDFLVYAAYFFPVIFLTVFMYFISLRASGRYYIFIIYLLILAVIHFLVKRAFFLKRQFKRNAMFVDFLENQDKKDFTPAETSSLPAGKLKAVKADLKKTGVGFIPHKLLLAAAALQGKKKTAPFAAGQLEKLIHKSLKYMFYEAIVFLVVLIPFMLISFLFSRGFTASIKLLTYTLGFLFVYFLDAAIFAPIFYLIIQAEAYRKFTA